MLAAALAPVAVIEMKRKRKRITSSRRRSARGKGDAEMCAGCGAKIFERRPSADRAQWATKAEAGDTFFTAWFF